MPENLFDALNTRAIPASVLKGSVVFRSGDRASAVYAVRKGKIALVWTGSNGVNPMDTRDPGTVIGLPGAFNGTYSTAARAVEDSELGWVSVNTLMELLESYPDLMREVTKLLANEVSRMRTLIAKHKG